MNVKTKIVKEYKIDRREIEAALCAHLKHHLKHLDIDLTACDALSFDWAFVNGDLGGVFVKVVWESLSEAVEIS